MPRPRSLSETAIASAALTLIDTAGMDALSMRNVAGELGMSTMGLYRYVAGRTELERLVVELILATVDIRTPPGTAWQRRIVLLCDRFRVAMSEHPSAAPLLAAHRHEVAASRRWAEAVLDVMAGSGLDAADQIVGMRTVYDYVTGALVAAPLRAHEWSSRAPTERSARDEYRSGLRVILRGLASELA